MQPEPPKPAPPPAAARVKVLVRYARISPRSGKPVTCALPGRKRKVVFDGLDNAQSAAAELEKTGARPQVPYQCELSRSGHYHLKTA